MHAKAIIDHGGKGVIDYMLVNAAPISREMQAYYAERGAYPVEVDEEAINALGIGFVKADIISETDLIRHVPECDADGLPLSARQYGRQRPAVTVEGDRCNAVFCNRSEK